VPKHIGEDPTSPHLTVPMELKGRIENVGDLDEIMKYKQRAETIKNLIAS
jgi:hypothetical protein